MQDGNQPNNAGQVIKPGDQPGVPSSAPSPQPPVEAQLPVAAPEPQPASIEPLVDQEDQPEPTQQPEGGGDSGAFVEWTASEYVANPKSAGWFATLMAASIVLAAVAYLVTKDVVSTVVIIILGIIVGVFAARQPQVLQYKVDGKGLYIGSKFYPYLNFKSFSIAQEHAIGYISLMPLKRFMPPLAIHYAPDDEERIAGTLADYLPYEDHKSDLVDNFTRRVRF